LFGFKEGTFPRSLFSFFDATRSTIVFLLAAAALGRNALPTCKAQFLLRCLFLILSLAKIKNTFEKKDMWKGP
jgi:hypothetical protein